MKYYLINYSLNGLGESGESCGSQYDISKGCPICGTGSELIEPLKVKGISSIKKDLFETRDGDWLVSNRLYDIISSDLRLTLKQAINHKNDPQNYWHLTGQNTLPKSREETKGIAM